jgi:hypothetical protein
MTDQHPISMPSPELAAKWVHEIYGNTVVIPLQKPTLQVIDHAVRWGADQELDACCELITSTKVIPLDFGQWLYSRRRPKPPSLKEEALQAAQRFYSNGHEDCNDEEVKDDFDIIRRALESLPD